MLINHFSDSKLSTYDGNTILNMYWQLKSDRYNNQDKELKEIIDLSYARICYELNRRIFS